MAFWAIASCFRPISEKCTFTFPSQLQGSILRPLWQHSLPVYLLVLWTRHFGPGSSSWPWSKVTGPESQDGKWQKVLLETTYCNILLTGGLTRAGGHVPRPVLNIYKAGDSTTSVGDLLQCAITFVVKKISTCDQIKILFQAHCLSFCHSVSSDTMLSSIRYPQWYPQSGGCLF